MVPAIEEWTASSGGPRSLRVWTACSGPRPTWRAQRRPRAPSPINISDSPTRGQSKPIRSTTAERTGVQRQSRNSLLFCPARRWAAERAATNPSFGYFSSLHDISHHLIRRDAFKVRFRFQHQAVPQDRKRRRFHIIGNQKVGGLHRRQSLGKQ